MEGEKKEKNMKITVVEGTSKEIADLLTELLKGQLKLKYSIGIKTLTKTTSDVIRENGLKTTHRQIPRD